MNAELYRRAVSVFEEICQLPRSEHATALDKACAGDAELRAQVESLLEADHAVSTGDFLRGRALEDIAAMSRQPKVQVQVPGPNTVLAGFRLGARIGAGGMGAVFEAEDLKLQRRVAVKVMPLKPAGDHEDGVSRFQRETRAASLLSHPNIVAIYDAGVEADWCYIAMEFVEGLTLRQLLALERRLSEADILSYLTQVASALNAAHQAGIVHRDIKPENIMVRDDGFVKVLDFGLAKLRARDNPRIAGHEMLTSPGSLPGTAGYLSPEQIRGAPADVRSDLFSLGVVAYELATGMRPFDGPTDGAVLSAALTITPPRPSVIRPDIGAQLDDLIMRLLEKDPGLRYQTAGDLHSSCRRMSNVYIAQAAEKTSSSGKSRKDSAPSEQPAPSKIRRVTWAAAVVAAVLGGAFWLTREPALPRVEGVTRLTGGGRIKSYFATEGTRLYYSAGNNDTANRMFQMSLNGGNPVEMPQLASMYPLDVSPDGSQILLAQFAPGGGVSRPLWQAPSIGGAPRRLGDLTGRDARFSPKRNEILYVDGAHVGIADLEGANPRVVASMKGYIVGADWAPDGNSIRLFEGSRYWDVNRDGSGLRQALPDWTNGERDGAAWTPGGKYFLFSGGPGRRDLWIVPKRNRWLGRSLSEPVRLTNGPFDAKWPRVSPDGRRVFFLGGLDSGELVRYDPKTQQWREWLGGMGAMQLDFSRDGKWICWISSSDGTVWRSSVDNGSRIQLTAPPLFARNPRWSPDGSTITFYGAPPGRSDRVYSVPAAGGSVRELTHGEGGRGGEADGNWSPDGTKILFGSQHGDQMAAGPGGLPLRMLDLRTQKVVELKGTNSLWGPRWSPDGSYIAALGSPDVAVWVYDLETRQKRQLTTMNAGWPAWSRDSRYIYFRNSAAYRVRVTDGAIERLADLSGVNLAGLSLGWVGVTPDGSLIATRDAGSTEVYSLQWTLP